MSARHHADALRRYFTASLGALKAFEQVATPWHSATFAGACHRLSFTVDPGVDVAAFACRLPEAELPLSGCFVADALVTAIKSTADGTRVSVELLMIDEP